MCTASWLLDKTGYQVFFNRDEQIGRAKAQPPSQFKSESDVNFLMPVDPVGQGSWIATNELGLTLCLLNFYQGDIPKGELISRGQLVRSFAHFSSAESLIGDFTKLNLSQYAPFTLVIFDAQLNSEQGHVKALQWDGKTLVDTLPLPPLISSAVDADTVRTSRRQLFTIFNANEESTASRLAFHHSHEPNKGRLSPCMHRDDAHTVSFTHVIVNKDEVNVNYQDGSPCMQAPYHKSTLAKLETKQIEKFA
ncbi:NRDE family protein [Vibrio sp. VB16]|uniref:NRDE family protein n=1 Tax=Vibrio sp. VB16 TaxID=2785746 RepID=UPI0018A01D55|nr:NRDE family protein [Vibrio sp. VB16]UGA56815.1 NRDE family protein [Vibrio sp. VB16]